MRGEATWLIAFWVKLASDAARLVACWKERAEAPRSYAGGSIGPCVKNYTILILILKQVL